MTYTNYNVVKLITLNVGMDNTIAEIYSIRMI